MRSTFRFPSIRTANELLATAVTVVALALTGCQPASVDDPARADVEAHQRGVDGPQKIDRENADPFGFRDGDARRFRDGFRRVQPTEFRKNMMGGQEGEPIFSGGFDTLNPQPPPAQDGGEDDADADPDREPVDEADTGVEDTGDEDTGI